MAGTRPPEGACEEAPSEAGQVVILLDTDHISILKYREHPRCVRLNERLAAAATTEALATTIVSAEEQFRGWMAEIHRERDFHIQTTHYEKLAKMLSFFAGWQAELFDADAVDGLMRLRQSRIRIGTQDLKIAAIAISRDALLLSANPRDFQRVPGLRVENWLE